MGTPYHVYTLYEIGFDVSSSGCRTVVAGYSAVSASQLLVLQSAKALGVVEGSDLVVEAAHIHSSLHTMIWSEFAGQVCGTQSYHHQNRVHRSWVGSCRSPVFLYWLQSVTSLHLCLFPAHQVIYTQTSGL